MRVQNRLLIQTEDGAPSEEGAAFIDACRQQNWLDRAETWVWDLVQQSSNGLYFAPGSSLPGIPIGSVEYISQYLDAAGYPPLRALNVPQELRTCRLLRRKVFDFPDKRTLLDCLKNGLKADLLVKPGGTPKRFQATTTAYLNEVPDDEPIFASEILASPIAAEWRAFVLRGEVRGICPYILQDWVVPDRGVVQEAARLIKTGSCTIDFAVLENGETVLLEAHPFIACGLYGFSGPDLLRMAKAAWREHLAPVKQALAAQMREAENALSRAMESRH